MAIFAIRGLWKARKLHRRRTFGGLDISVESQAGSDRHWEDPHNGTSGKTRMLYDYGYVRGSIGADGDHVDVYVGHNAEATHAYVIDQRKTPDFTKFDEQKVMLGFDGAAAAKKAYLAHYDNPKFFGSMRAMPMDIFRGKVLNTSKAKPLVKAKDKIPGGRADKGRPKGATDAQVAKGVAHEMEHTNDPDIAREIAHDHLAEDPRYYDKLAAMEGKLAKAGPHKYKSRKRNTKGGYDYDYGEPKKARTGVVAIDEKRLRATVAELGAQFYGPPDHNGFSHAKGSVEKDMGGGLVIVLAPQGESSGLGNLRKRADGKTVATAFLVDAVHGTDSQLATARNTLAHELTHHNDPSTTKGKLGASLDRALTLLAEGKHDEAHREIGLPDGSEAEKHTAYVNLKHEVTAKLQEIHRDLIDKPSAKLLAEKDAEYDTLEGPALLFWARHSSDRFADDFGALDAPNQKRMMRMIAATATGLREGTIQPIEKSRTVRYTLSKAGPHKYKSRKRNAKGGWDYEYADDGATRQREAKYNYKTIGTGSEPATGNVDRIARLVDASTHKARRLDVGEWQREQLPDDTDKAALESAVPKLRKAEDMDIQSPGESVKFPKLYILRKAVQKPPAGFGPIPGSKKGGFRKRGKRGWTYWYPEAAGKEDKHKGWNEKAFREGNYDRDPTHWQIIRAGANNEVIPWVAGGIDPESAHPVKVAGMDHAIWAVARVPEHRKGWALLVHMINGEQRMVKHDRIYPIEHGTVKLKNRPVVKRGEGDNGAGPPDDMPPIGDVIGSRQKMLPYPQSTARKGTILSTIEQGGYPTKQVRRYEEDADGGLHVVKRSAMGIPDGDKMELLNEFRGMTHKIVSQTAKRFGMKLSNEQGQDLRSAALEGMLNAMDSYPGGVSFVKHASIVASNYARLHAVRDFAGGLHMPKRYSRQVGGFIAARAEATRIHGDNPTAEQIAQEWKIRKRDIHSKLDQGGEQQIPLKSYKLREGDLRSSDRPGRVELAQQYMSFLDGQRSAEGSTFFEGEPIIPDRAGEVMGETERILIRDSMDHVFEMLGEREVVTGGKRYRLDVGEVLSRKLGFHGGEEESMHSVALHVPVAVFSGEPNVKGGSWSTVPPGHARPAIEQAIKDGIEFAREQLGETRGGYIMAEAGSRILDPDRVHSGPTFGDDLRRRASEVTREDVREWRERERGRLGRLADRHRQRGEATRADELTAQRESLKSIGLRRARRLIAMHRIQAAPANMAWFRSAIPTRVDFEDPRNEYGTMDISAIDPTTGVKRTMRVRSVTEGNPESRMEGAPGTVTGLTPGIEKSETAGSARGSFPDAWVPQFVAAYPMLANLMFASDDPVAHAATKARESVLELMGVFDE